jgi:hypothetical protein
MSASAVLPVVGDIINTASTLYTNAQNRKFSEQMYDRQRADALVDWDKQNKYNSPSQQMQRYKEAGLNPNLIYGQMSNSAAIRSTDMKHPDFVAPKLPNIGNTMNNIIDLKLKQQQLSNDKQAGELLREQTKGKSLENDNLIDQSPYIAEEKFQRSRLTGQQVENVMADIRNKETINPLQQDQIRSQLQTLSQNRKYQAILSDQKIGLNKLLSQTMEQAIRLKGNQFELDKLSNELSNTLKKRMIQAGYKPEQFSTNEITDLLKILY